MEFFRVYVQSEGTPLKRGAICVNGDIEKDPDRKLWFNPESGTILHFEKDDTENKCYHLSCIPGNESFVLRFFNGQQEKKSLEQLLGADKIEAKPIEVEPINKGNKNGRQKRSSRVSTGNH